MVGKVMEQVGDVSKFILLPPSMINTAPLFCQRLPSVILEAELMEFVLIQKAHGISRQVQLLGITDLSVAYPIMKKRRSLQSCNSAATKSFNIPC